MGGRAGGQTPEEIEDFRFKIADCRLIEGR
jgi:hypothetical protein